MDADLRNSLWNSILERFGGESSHWAAAAQLMGKHFYKEPLDTVPEYNDQAGKWLRQRFFQATWHEVYDILEFLVVNVDVIKRPSRSSGYERYYSNQAHDFVQEVNHVLERELSGYRFVRGVLAPITDPAEVASIENAASHLSGDNLLGASTHIRAALSLLGQKPTPDYRNSIKESISAVESAVNHLAGTAGGGVAKAVEIVGTKVEIHPGLRAALKQLYGFTSDADGIRHAILEQSTVGFAEAKFMLVACSAFVNFLLEKGREGGLIA